LCGDTHEACFGDEQVGPLDNHDGDEVGGLGLRECAHVLALRVRVAVGVEDFALLEHVREVRVSSEEGAHVDAFSPLRHHEEGIFLEIAAVV